MWLALAPRDAMKVRLSSLAIAILAALSACASGDAATELAAQREAIVNGHAASSDETWGTVGILAGHQQEEWLCTGTLIQPDLIVTAAHCLFEPGDHKTRASWMKVVAGSKNVDDPDEDEQYEVARVLPHPGALDELPTEDEAGLGTYKDIALIRTTKAIDQVDTINILSADAFDQALSPGASVIVSGYGRREVDLQGVSSKDGLLYVGEATFQRRTDAEFLAGGESGNEADTCPGDSGGPVYVEQDDEMYLVGATSRGRDDFPDAECGKGGVYTIVPKYQSWIDESASHDDLGSGAWTPEGGDDEEGGGDGDQPSPGGGLGSDDQDMPLKGGKLEFCAVSGHAGRPSLAAILLVITATSLRIRRRRLAR
jgi:secreted trypsin-like serine protease